MDEVKLGIAQHRGVRAAELLSNELLQNTFQELETTYLDAWKATKARDTDARERLWQAIQILGIVQENLKQHVRNGRLAADDLRRLSEEAKRKQSK